VAAKRATVGDVVAVLDALYPPAWAESWDAVGLVCGDPDDRVSRVVLAVDPVLSTADEAVDAKAQLLFTHHPLFLKPVHGVAATTPKGRLVHRLITNGVALHTAHTNGDSANPGVSDALAAALALEDLTPLDGAGAEALDKVVTFVPHADAEKLLDALTEAGAGSIGDYSRCAWTAQGEGTFRPEPGANPTLGSVGEIERVPETRIEMVLPRASRTAVIRALKAAHPYEEPAYDVFELAELPGNRGIGRIGVLSKPMPLKAFAQRVKRALPRTAGGVRVAGDPARTVERVAVCGGAGDSLLAAARASQVDAYVTADLRHHPASEHVEAGGPALLDVAHWASEWPWLQRVAEQVTAGVAERTGASVECIVSTRVTDPWTGAV
jgi:dinuclear metal center YbgI/SA1388 family protein